MDAAKEKAKRISLFVDAVRGGEKPERVPHFCNFWSWKVQDAGYTLSQAIYDNDIMYDVIKQWMEKYPQFDTHYETGQRNPLLIGKAVGINEYIINDEANSLNIVDQCFMNEDEYAELGEDYLKFYWTKALPRRAKQLNLDDPIPQLKDGVREYQAFIANQIRIKKMIQEEYGVPLMYENAIGFSGLEWLFNYIRGIKGLSIDLRRRPDEVKATSDAISARTMNRYENNPNAYVGHSTSAVFDYYICMLAHSILNPKQFEIYYMPWLRYMGEMAEKWDKTLFIFQEASSDRFWDMLSELPANRFCIYSEQDDIFDQKKRLTNMTPGGGMPQVLMGNGTPQECVDYAKKLIDEIGCDGKYVFGINKMISFPNDVRKENLIAVNEFVYDYKMN